VLCDKYSNGGGALFGGITQENLLNTSVLTSTCGGIVIVIQSM
jgi:hypothetical protein